MGARQLREAFVGCAVGLNALVWSGNGGCGVLCACLMSILGKNKSGLSCLSTQKHIIESREEKVLNVGGVDCGYL